MKPLIVKAVYIFSYGLLIGLNPKFQDPKIKLALSILGGFLGLGIKTPK